MRKSTAVLASIALVMSLTSCFYIFQPEDYFGFSKTDFTVIEELDAHGGFLGDGYYYLILDCTNDPDAALNIAADWNPLPLSENLDRIMYSHSGYNLSEEAHMPAIKNGYYCFEDRHSEATDPSDDSELFSRYSYNFSLAVYDADTNRFYYFEYDT